ncbi:universal stress protein [Streptomyces sp. NPDC099050]|uniref:universal stress protein n=1 Tax=Streptomyces sp. NPDC099050 TaxID=3366100 RepID=UPI0038141D30
MARPRRLRRPAPRLERHRLRRPGRLPRGGGPARRAAAARPVRAGRTRPQQRGARLQVVVAHAWPGRTFTAAGAIGSAAAHEETGNAHEVAALAAVHLRPYAERFPEVEIEQPSAPGDAAGHLVAASQAADLMVIGRHRKRPLAPRLGSVTHAVLLHTGCPVAVVPLEESAVPAAA